MKLPASLTLPSGAKVGLRAASAPRSPRQRSAGAPLFSEVLALFDDGTVTLTGAEVRDLALPDFHVLRAVLIKHGFAFEEEIEITCENCGAPLAVRPCARLEIGPYVDGELEDPELDSLEPEGVIHEIPGLGPTRLVRRTVRQAEPLFRAAASDPLVITPEVAEAMGVVGEAASALATCDDDAFDEVSHLFLRMSYPARLGAILFCPKCRARSDVDAPYERELAPAARGERSAASTLSPLPPFEAFAERVRVLAEPLLASAPGEKIELVVEGGTPDVDDGGEPLLGSYVPPDPGDVGMPSRPPTITVYYRTFEALEADEGPYDWEGELEETLEHELEHHVYALTGDDPMDSHEREEIDREALRIIGRHEATRRTVATFGESLGDFLRRAWPLFVLALVALLLALLSAR